jgi:hypothetical protein
MGADARRPGGSRDDLRQWMLTTARRIDEVVAARWDATRSPLDFLERHATGARFTALPRAVRDEALQRLREWAFATFGNVNTMFTESHEFVLALCVF